MELVTVFMLCVMSCLIGAVSMLLIEYVIFVKYFDSAPKDDGTTTRNGSVSEDFAIPKGLMVDIHSADASTKNPVMAFNLIFQFLFFDLRYSTKVRDWFYRKITKEMDELIVKTSISKFFAKFSLRDLDFGTEFPEVKDIRVHNVNLHETEGHIETLDLVMDVQYNGNFKVAIDGDMVMDKKIFLAVKIKHLSGLCRLQFTRKPYSHWNISFIGDPKIDMDIETLFQGRSLQPSLTGLLSNQIRKAIRRKHTLPIFKIRYKPFFQKLQLDYDLADVEPSGRLDINVSELSRLILPNTTNHVFCTVALSPVAWVQARQVSDTKLLVTLDVTIHRAKNQQIGIIFRQSNNAVIVDNIIPNTPATMANVLPDDVLVYIENKKVFNVTQIYKIVKGITKKEVTLRLERIVDGTIWNDNGCDHNLEVYEDMDDFSNITFSKETDSVQIGQKGARKGSNDKEPAVDTILKSLPSTPSTSPKKSLKLKDNQDTQKLSPLTRKISETIDVSKSSISMSNKPLNSSSSSVFESDKEEERETILLEELAAKMGGRKSVIDDKIQQHTTIDVLANTTVRINDLTHFELNKSTLWLNLCVFGRCNDDVELLGYANYPVPNMLFECAESNLWQIIRKLTLRPPLPPDFSNHPLSNINGFEPRLCYGEALLSFVWSGATAQASETKKTKKDDEPTHGTQHHNFVRTHFPRATYCDYCGKKIWLKEAAQCKNCSMSCHKKCTKKCQMSTVCTIASPAAVSAAAPTVELQVIESEKIMYTVDDSESPPEAEATRASTTFSALIAQNIQRVNSANNLTIPGMGASPGHSRSLPQSPHHSPRKQSLVNQSTNPFVAVVQKLEQLPDVVEDISEEQIRALTEPLTNWGSSDDLMGLAKTASRSLYGDVEPSERMLKINVLLARLRIALDLETAQNVEIAALVQLENGSSSGASNAGASPTTTPSRKLSSAEGTRTAFLKGQSDERVQALSVVMLFLCSGLQHAQGVAA